MQKDKITLPKTHPKFSIVSRLKEWSKQRPNSSEKVDRVTPKGFEGLNLKTEGTPKDGSKFVLWARGGNIVGWSTVGSANAWMSTLRKSKDSKESWKRYDRYFPLQKVRGDGSMCIAIGEAVEWKDSYDVSAEDTKRDIVKYMSKKDEVWASVVGFQKSGVITPAQEKYLRKAEAKLNKELTAIVQEKLVAILEDIPTK